VEMALHNHQMQMKLKESEKLFATTLKSIGDAVITTDQKGSVTFMNPVAESLTGWSRQEALGRELAEVFNTIDEQTREAAENPVKRVLRESDAVRLANHVVLVAKDNTELPIDDTAAPIRDGKGNIIGIVLAFRDASERKQAEEALRNSE